MGGDDSMGHNSHSSGDGGDDDNMGHTNHNNSVRGSTKDHTNHSMGLSNPNTIAMPNCCKSRATKCSSNTKDWSM